jgi:hypothetical protein
LPFLAETQHLPQSNLAVQLLEKMLDSVLKIRSKKYLVQSLVEGVKDDFVGMRCITEARTRLLPTKIILHAG